MEPHLEKLKPGRTRIKTKILLKVSQFHILCVVAVAIMIDAKHLDTWVLETMKELFKNASNDGVLDQQLRAPGTIFFLHLLGLDTTGHAYRPHSKVIVSFTAAYSDTYHFQEYMENIIHVDSIVKQTEALFKSFYRSEAKRTAYIFTADHGMSNLGNHGDGGMRLS